VTATRVTAPPVDTPGSVGSVEDLQRENEQLRTALATRIVIEQAKGMLAERLQVEIEVAFERLRRETRNRRMKLHAVAAAVVAREPWTDTSFPPGTTGDPR
jgi:AmiR/NasT family two-component response regulator